MAPTLWDRVKNFRRRPIDPFTKASKDGLDLVMTPRYEMTEEIRSELRAEIDDLVARLRPDAVDAYNREVLDGWIAARAEQFGARLDADREERKAVGDALVGLARQEVAKRKSRYDADLNRLHQAREALAVAREQLTVSPEIDAVHRPEPGPIASTLGAVDLTHQWEVGPPASGDENDPPPERNSADPPLPRPRNEDDVVEHPEFVPPPVEKENGNGQ